MNQPAPDEFDAVIALPPPKPRKPKRPLVTWRDLRMLVLCTVASIAVMVALLYGLAALMFLPHQLAHTTQIGDYPRLLPRFQRMYRSHMQLFPPSVPPGALQTELDANPESMLQASPHMSLRMRLTPTDAAAEFARLHAIQPDRVGTQSGANAPSGSGPDRGIHINWDTGRVRASASFNPQSGWFNYEISGG